MRIIGVSIGLICALLVIHPTDLTVAADEWVRVKWVDDGDTILLEDRRRIRYIGINAPEVAHGTDRITAEPHGDEARAKNRSLLLGHRVRLEFDRESKDHYGRVLAYVYLNDGTFVNLAMVESGYAYVLFLKPNTRFDRDLLEGQRRAMKAGLGIWQGWKEGEDKGGYIGNSRSRRFHDARCPNAAAIHFKNRVYLSSRWEAFWKGYAPAKQCNPHP